MAFKSSNKYTCYMFTWVRDGTFRSQPQQELSALPGPLLFSSKMWASSFQFFLEVRESLITESPNDGVPAVEGAESEDPCHV